MIIFYLLLVINVFSKTSDDELREAACVIFSRYILQVQSDYASPPIGMLINEQKMTQDDAIYIVQSAALEKCLDNIKQREVTRILDALQNQELDLNRYKHLHEEIQFDRFINNKPEKAKLNQLIDIIKDVEELIATQWQRKPEAESNRQDKSEEIDPDIELDGDQPQKQQKFDITKVPFKQIFFRNKEALLFALFALVPVILFINSCFKSKGKGKKTQDVKKETKKDVKEEEKKSSEKQEGKKETKAKKE